MFHARTIPAREWLERRMYDKVIIAEQLLRCFLKFFVFTIVFSIAIFWGARTHAHGGVVFEEDQCVLKLGFMNLHFTGFQIASQNRREFCEDIPKIGETLFVIDSLHDYLAEMVVEFRIIRDVNKFGVYAGMEDVKSLGDLAETTEFLLPFASYPDGVIIANHQFVEPGGYIGVVTAVPNGSDDIAYEAAFFFRVGGRSYWEFFVFVLALCILQDGYMAGNGSLRWFRTK